MDKTETLIKCANCGLSLEETSKPVPDRLPCPKCGSISHHISVNITGTIAISGSMGISHEVFDNTSLLIKSVIIPSNKTSEGLLIKAVAIPWFEIIANMKNDPAVAFQLSPEKWEEIIAGAYHLAGFDEVVLTPRSGDFGRDVIAIKKGLGQVRIIDQVKAYNPRHLVTANDVRALMGCLHNDGAAKGFLTTTSDFAPKIKSDPLITPLMPQRLELINGKQLFQRLEELGQLKPIGQYA